MPCQQNQVDRLSTLLKIKSFMISRRSRFRNIFNGKKDVKFLQRNKKNATRNYFILQINANRVFK